MFLTDLCRGQATSFNISTVAGNTIAGFAGDNAAATSAQLNAPIQVAVDGSHNLYIADSVNNRIRKVAAGKISTVAGSNTLGYAGDGAAATKAALNDPYGVWLDASGNLFIADLGNNVIREVAANGNITTVAGSNVAGPGYSGDGGPATSAQFNQPFGLVTDAAGNLYITDSANHRIRMVDTNGNITTIAGTGTAAFAGDGGPATIASLNRPFGLCLDRAGNLYFADSANQRIRKVDTSGIITTVAGTGTAGSTGDGGPATKAQIYRPWDVKVDSAGDLFIADYDNSRIRIVTPDGVINTIAGGSGPGYSGDGSNATGAKLNFPTGLAIDTNGDLYISDSGSNVIRQLTPTGPTVSAGGVVSAGAFGAFSAIAPGTWIEIYGSNLSTDRRSWGATDFQGAQAPTMLDGTGVTIGGQAAFVDFISGGQVNAQVPSNVPTGSQTLTVKTPSGTTAAYSVTVNAVEPGLLTQFTVGGVPYAGAFFTDGTYVLPPGAVSGINSRRAKAGDTIVLYGVGFGPVTPTISAGQIVQLPNQLVVAPQIMIGQTPASVTFAGLVQGSVGLYQFNVVVPSVTATDKVPVTFSVGGAAGTQTLYTTVQ